MISSSDALSAPLRLDAAQAARWFPRLGPGPHSNHEPARLRLICWPFAGGSAASFAAWPAALSAQLGGAVELRALQLPGRGARLTETPLTQVNQLRPWVQAALEHFADLPLVFFGHSLGALLAYDAIYHGQGAWRLQLRRVILSAKPGPHIPPAVRRHQLPTAELLKELENFGGTPPELLAHREFMEMILPSLRADFAMVENYLTDCSPLQRAPLAAADAKAELPLAGAVPIDVPLSLWWGEQDQQAQRAQLQEWRPYFTAECEERAFTGGHFYLNAQAQHVWDALSHCLNHELRHCIAG